MTYFIGIDLAKYKHDCFIMDENGEVIRDSFSFNNDKEGFNTLLNVLNSLDSNVSVNHNPSFKDISSTG